MAVRRLFHSRRPRMAPLTLADVNPALLRVEYAVRGELALRAEEYRQRLLRPGHGLPFRTVVGANIGNPQAKGLDQPPLTFPRQVAALTEYPPLLDADAAPALFPADVRARAAELVRDIGSVGAYSHSQGVPLIRQHVAEFIQARDGFPADPQNIFLTAGASEGVSLLIGMLVSSPAAGILIPIPQYPLYTAALAQHAGVPVPYFLDEADGWSTAPDDVERALHAARQQGTQPRALVVINPGNPTGSVLDEPTMLRLVQLAEQHSLVLLADEVYQDNLHDRAAHPFTSFKKVVAAARSPVALVSFHSISKGVTGECGRRGGYFEATNLSPDIHALLYKMRSVTLCPPLAGQIGVDCLVRPPQPGTPSYPLWRRETDAIHAALRTRTRLMAQRLNQLEGVSCVDSPGALYLFPRIRLPPRACAAAREQGREPDAFYALALLDRTGICTVPGSGFGQREGELHYRLTCLCEGVDEYVGALEGFHREFMDKYRD